MSVAAALPQALTLADNFRKSKPLSKAESILKQTGLAKPLERRLKKNKFGRAALKGLKIAKNVFGLGVRTKPSSIKRRRTVIRKTKAAGKRKQMKKSIRKNTKATGARKPVRKSTKAKGKTVKRTVKRK